jgi:hypothetical protein
VDCAVCLCVCVCVCCGWMGGVCGDGFVHSCLCVCMYTCVAPKHQHMVYGVVHVIFMCLDSAIARLQAICPTKLVGDQCFAPCPSHWKPFGLSKCQVENGSGLIFFSGFL